jgi:hypothetical protein
MFGTAQAFQPTTVVEYAALYCSMYIILYWIFKTKYHESEFWEELHNAMRRKKIQF